MIGQLCFNVGQAKNTYGTGCFMLLNTGEQPVVSTHGLLTTVCFQLGPKAPVTYALEGSVAVAGSGVQWMRDKMHLIKSSADINTLAAQCHDCHDLYFVPAFSGLLSPYWRDDARGVIVGLTHSSNHTHLARAVLYSSAYQTAEVLQAMMNDTHNKVKLTTLQVDGGMAASDILLQFQADLLANVPVVRPSSLEATAAGAAYCAGLCVKYWSSTKQIVELMSSSSKSSGVGSARIFKSSMSKEKREQLLNGWYKAVKRTFNWVEKDHKHTNVDLQQHSHASNHSSAIAASASFSSSSAAASSSSSSSHPHIKRVILTPTTDHPLAHHHPSTGTTGRFGSMFKQYLSLPMLLAVGVGAVLALSVTSLVNRTATQPKHK